jgi:hypothetical protein
VVEEQLARPRNVLELIKMDTPELMEAVKTAKASAAASMTHLCDPI